MQRLRASLCQAGEEETNRRQERPAQAFRGEELDLANETREMFRAQILANSTAHGPCSLRV